MVQEGFEKIELKDICLIRDRIFALKKFHFDGEMRYTDYDGVSVFCDGMSATIGFCSRATLARGFFLLAKSIMEEKKQFDIKQKPQYPSCGVMLDMSRNGVMRPEKVKEYLVSMAALGLNLLMLYIEDTYEIKGYPFFGYQRGRYTLEELRSIDDFASELGIEVVPCIQTLGHLAQYTQWGESNPITDKEGILLIDEPRTYEFIEAAIRTVRQAFRSGRINVGLDEAYEAGLGRYLVLHGYQDRFEMLNRHLQKVIGICQKYSFQPMMWSDMYFYLGSKTQNYFDINSDFPQAVIDSIPDVGMVYWDYYHKDAKTFEGMIKGHQRLGKEIIFAGGIWTWDSLVPNSIQSFDTMRPALKLCGEYGIRTVIATLWSNSCCELNHFMALSLLPLFSEYCYIGNDCSDEQIWEMGEFLGGIPEEPMTAMADFHYARNGDSVGRGLFHSDLLYDLIGVACDYADLQKKCEDGINLMVQYIARNDQNKEWYRLIQLFFRIAACKADLYRNLQVKYRARDLDYLHNLLDNKLPALKANYEQALMIHKKTWLSTYKATGFECINYRYGGIMARIDYAVSAIGAYLNGEADKIEELEEDRLADGRRQHWWTVRRLITPSANGL